MIFKVTIDSLSNGSVHSSRIKRETFMVVVNAGKYERQDACAEAHALYRTRHPSAICPAVVDIVPVA